MCAVRSIKGALHVTTQPPIATSNWEVRPLAQSRAGRADGYAADNGIEGARDGNGGA